jgi:hypothetical protein
MMCAVRRQDVGAVAALCCVLAACGTSTSSSLPGTIRTFTLLTHCGIDEALIGNSYYEAEQPLSDGHGNPPDGWPNPTDVGNMTVNADHPATFRDGQGHVVGFRLRVGARDYKSICS